MPARRIIPALQSNPASGARDIDDCHFTRLGPPGDFAIERGHHRKAALALRDIQAAEEGFQGWNHRLHENSALHPTLQAVENGPQGLSSELNLGAGLRFAHERAVEVERSKVAGDENEFGVLRTKLARRVACGLKRGSVEIGRAS